MSRVSGWHSGVTSCKMEPRVNRALSVIVVCIRSTWKREATVFEPCVTLVQCHFKHQV